MRRSDQERFPGLWTNDEEVAQLIHGEVTDALIAGRASFVAPLELVENISRWEARRGGLTVWTPMKSRGYVLIEEPAIDGGSHRAQGQGTSGGESEDVWRNRGRWETQELTRIPSDEQPLIATLTPTPPVVDQA